LNCEDFNIRDFLADIVILFEEQTKFKRIQLLQEVDSRVPTIIYSDPKRIKQILMNLISNALKFTNKGHITVRINIDDFNPSETAEGCQALLN
jgi:histidine kinase 2/3/4 (cytokinin receptor)